MKGKLYKITNTINNKVYIGKTYKTIEQRFKEHIRSSMKKIQKHRPLYNAMNKYGTDKFSIELINIYEQGLLEEMEIEFIEKYDSYHNGYNATLGGDGMRTFSYSDEEVIAKYKELKYVCKTSEYFNCTEYTIRAILRSNDIIIKNWGDIKITNAKKIAKLDKKTLEIIETFSSIREAARSLGNERKCSHINDVCNGRQKTAYGFKWKYI